ncbi:hypothetical protein DesLBE_4150 [Desulfitobacterium sp. LBE]|nr:hypothetical protein DesLBE_4150 [Desulfitobacterium sp. LBE]
MKGIGIIKFSLVPKLVNPANTYPASPGEVKGKVEIFQRLFAEKYDLTLTNSFFTRLEGGLATFFRSKALITRFYTALLS